LYIIKGASYEGIYVEFERKINSGYRFTKALTQNVKLRTRSLS